MRRVIVIAVAGASLAGCSSFSMDAFKSAPPTVQGGDGKSFIAIAGSTTKLYAARMA